MSNKQTPFRNTFTTSAKGQAEYKRIAKTDIGERLAALNILNPDEVAGGYDAKRLLMTTLGGAVRPITQDDLAQFRHLARQLGKKFKGGITAKQVIDLSLSDRIERAHGEIRTAMPITNRGSRVQFQTNSGPKSKVARHHVIVEFMNYDAVVASPIPAVKIVGEMLKGKIKIDCSCEDTRFMFRYIQTVGRFNAGRPETGFPKLKNSQLRGVACKHTLRVMALINQSPTFKNWAVRMIENGRKTLDGKRKVEKVADMEQFAEALKKESHRQRRVATTDEKRAERARWAGSKPVVDLKAAAAEKAKKRAVGSATKALQNNVKKLLMLGAINQKQADAMLAAVKG